MPERRNKKNQNQGEGQESDPNPNQTSGSDVIGGSADRADGSSDVIGGGSDLGPDTGPASRQPEGGGEVF
jgi:hypothetical protein